MTANNNTATTPSEFLNPKSMITPGIAGGIVMLISNTLLYQFSIPAKWTALLLSFAIGCIVLIDQNTSKVQKIVFYLLNSLIIFSVAAGTGTALAAAKNASITASTNSNGTTNSWPYATPEFRLLLSNAYYATKTGQSTNTANYLTNLTLQKVFRDTNFINWLTNASAYQPEGHQFFRSWFENTGTARYTTT